MLEDCDKICQLCDNAKAKDWIKEFWSIMSFQVKASARIIKKRSGSLLIKSGDLHEAVYFLIKGTVKIYKELPNGILYEIASLKAPCLVGETEAITGLERSRGTVYTTSDESALIYMSNDVFISWLKSNNEALFKITKIIVNKNVSQQSKDRTMLFSHGYERLAYRIISYYEEENTTGTVSLNVSRESLSEDTGLNIRSISRALKKLEENGYISKRGRSIVVTKEQVDKMKLHLFNI